MTDFFDEFPDADAFARDHYKLEHHAYRVLNLLTEAVEAGGMDVVINFDMHPTTRTLLVKKGYTVMWKGQVLTVGIQDAISRMGIQEALSRQCSTKQ